MRRRSFLATVAGAFLAPSAFFRSGVDAAAIMRSFCDPDHAIYAIDRPFVDGGAVWATNCRQAIRGDGAEVEPEGEALRRPRITRALAELIPVGSWRPWRLPSIDELTLRQRDGGICPACEWKRRIVLDEYPPEESIAHDPAFALYDVDDNSIVDPACELCRGREYLGPTVVQVAGAFHCYALVKKLAAIPGLEVCESRRDGSNLLNDQVVRPMLFRGGGFFGASMPLVYDCVLDGGRVVWERPE